MAKFETIRNDENKVVCEFDYDNLTIATKSGGKDIRYGILDAERLIKNLLIKGRSPPNKDLKQQEEP